MDLFSNTTEIAIISLFVAIIGLCITGAGLLIAYGNRRTEQVKLTRDLYNQFFAITDDRIAAWHWLKELDLANSPLTFKELWQQKDHKEDFMSLYKVLAFWFGFYTLYNAKQLNNKLANSLFSYEFCYWQKVVEPLALYSFQQEKIFPNVLQPFESKNWLLNR